MLYDFCTRKWDGCIFLPALPPLHCCYGLHSVNIHHIKFGKPEEKPEHSNFAWIPMMFTAGVGSSIVIMGFLEPIYYVTDTPFSLEPFSEQAYEYAHMYGQFHWGLSAWAFYTPAVVAVAYAMFVRKDRKIRISTACRPIIGKHADGWVGNLIDIFVVFGIIGSIGTSLGIGAPVVSEVLRQVFGISKKYGCG